MQVTMNFLFLPQSHKAQVMLIKISIEPVTHISQLVTLILPQMFVHDRIKFIKIIGVAGNHFAAEQIIFASIEITNLATGLFQNDNSGCYIPRMQGMFLEPFESSGGHVSHVGSS